MIAATAILFLDGVLILSLLWISVNYLYRQKQVLASAMDVRRLVNVVKFFILAPPAIALIAAIIFGIFLQNEFFVQFAHAFFLLGLWVTTALLIFALLMMMRLKSVLQAVAMLGFLCAILPILFFTSIISFQNIFGQAGQFGYIFPLLEGIALIGICYPILRRLESAFS